MSSTSAIWSPTFMTGLSAVIGSWKIIEMRSPRMRRISAGDLSSRSSPSSSTRPAVAVSCPGGSRPMTACAVTDFPEPDSPTTQTISPGATANETFSTAFRRSAPVGQADGEALHVEHRLGVDGHHTRRASFGSSRSRKPSPSTLTASTVNARQMPGKKMLCG